MLEMEAGAGYHATGRSAALFSRIYGNDTIRGLSRASAPFLFAPPDGFAPVPLVRPRPTMFIARSEQMDTLRALAEQTRGALRFADSAEARRRVASLRPGYVAGCALDETSADIDVDALLQGFVRQLRRAGGELHLGQRVTDIRAGGRASESRWEVVSDGKRLHARVLVNAAGAWADEVADMAGVGAIGLRPMRRTAALIDPPPGTEPSDWPAVIDIDERFYFKPDAGQVLISPADETESPPCDAQPEEWDVAVAVDRYCTAVDHDVRRIRHRWAGLRTFAADRSPVVGYDPHNPCFFWLAGQGGYGIQTAWALGETAAALVRGLPLPATVAAEGVRIEALAPSRFRAAGDPAA